MMEAYLPNTFLDKFMSLNSIKEKNYNWVSYNNKFCFGPHAHFFLINLKRYIMIEKL